MLLKENEDVELEGQWPQSKFPLQVKDDLTALAEATEDIPPQSQKDPQETINELLSGTLCNQAVTFTLLICAYWFNVTHTYGKDFLKRAMRLSPNYGDNIMAGQGASNFTFFIFVGRATLGVPWVLVADVWGRKPILMAAFLALISADALIMYPTRDPKLINAAAVFIGGAMQGLKMVSFVLTMESATDAMGAWVNASIGIVEASLTLLYIGIDFLVLQDVPWHHYFLYCGIPCVMLPFIVIMSYESPRWLYANGDCEKAKEILREISGVEEVNIPDVNKEERVPAWRQLLSMSAIKPIFIFIFAFASGNTLYYGYINNLKSFDQLGLTTHKLLAMIIGVQIPAYLFMGALASYISPRLAMASLWLATAGCCVGYMLIPRLYFCLTGFLFASSAYQLTFQLVSEESPTQLRSTIMGLCNLCARLCSASTAHFDSMSSSTVMILFATLATTEALLLLWFDTGVLTQVVSVGGEHASIEKPTATIEAASPDGFA